MTPWGDLKLENELSQCFRQSDWLVSSRKTGKTLARSRAMTCFFFFNYNLWDKKHFITAIQNTCIQNKNFMKFSYIKC